MKNIDKYRYHEQFLQYSWFLIHENFIKWKWGLYSRIENHTMIFLNILMRYEVNQFVLKIKKMIELNNHEIC